MRFSIPMDLFFGVWITVHLISILWPIIGASAMFDDYTQGLIDFSAVFPADIDAEQSDHGLAPLGNMRGDQVASDSTINAPRPQPGDLSSTGPFHQDVLDQWWEKLFEDDPTFGLDVARFGNLPAGDKKAHEPAIPSSHCHDRNFQAPRELKPFCDRSLTPFMQTLARLAKDEANRVSLIDDRHFRLMEASTTLVPQEGQSSEVESRTDSFQAHMPEVVIEYNQAALSTPSVYPLHGRRGREQQGNTPLAQENLFFSASTHGNERGLVDRHSGSGNNLDRNTGEHT